MMDITVTETRFFRDLKEEAQQKGREAGMQQGMQQGAALLVLSRLTDQFGNLPADDEKQISSLPISRLQELNKQVSEFSDLTDLQNWIARQQSDADA